MRWIVMAIVLAACGGTKIPQHAGYKNEKLKPWKKPKTLKLGDDNEARTEGELSYREYRRARWYAVNLPSHGELTVKLEITPPGDEVNEDFDLALEVYDPKLRVISKSDLEEEDAGELNKAKTLFDLDAGRYLIHVYLQGRLDSADFLMRVGFKPTTPPEQQTDFPSQVAFVPPLPMVPLDDDAPATYRRPTTVVTTTRQPKKPPPKPDDPKPTAVLTARIVGISVDAGKTKVILGRGTETGAQSGMKATLTGVGTVAIQCNASTCTALFNATPDKVRSAGGSVTLTP
jgi:hypothetical protein